MLWTPRPYQPITRDFIIDTPRCNIWLDMGMGKTVSALTALDILWLAGSRFWPALVIAPKRVARDTWAPEAEKWDHLKHLRVSAIIGDRKTRCAAALRKADVYTINYENIPWLVEFFQGQKRWPFKIVIADESRKLAGFRLRHGGIRAAALSRVAKLTGRWVNMTGTPAPEGLKDLWGPQWFVDFGGAIGRSHTSFAERWFRKTEFGIEALAHAQEEVMEKLAPTTLSLRAKDWFDDYYDPTPKPVYFDLTGKARQIYEDMEIEMFAEIDSITEVEAMNSGSKYGKCSQIASGAIYTDEHGNWKEIHDQKLHCLADIFDELCGDPLLVVYHFKHDLARLRKKFPFLRVYDTKQDEEDWNAGKLKGMLIHAASAGHGLNFQDGGCNIAFFSQVPSLELRQQVIERLGPIRQIQSGHPRPVLVWDIIARNTVNEVDYARAASKASTQDAIRAYRDRKRR